jgi:hypothetical protein
MADEVYERHNPEYKRIQFLESELKAGAELVAKLSDRIMELENNVLTIREEVRKGIKEKLIDIYDSVPNNKKLMALEKYIEAL